MPHLTIGGLHLAYEDTGPTSGTPLLLLPGLGMRLEHWAPHLPRLSAGRRVIALDARGGAESETPPGPYSTKRMAKDALDALDALGLERADVLGLSMGGFIAQHLAVIAPERVRRLVLALTAIQPNARGRARLRVELALRQQPETRELYFRELFLWLFDDATFAREDALERLVQAAVERDDAETPEGILCRATACLEHDGAGLVPNITTPTLVIGAKHDLIYPPSETQALADAIRSARLELIEGAHVLTGPAIRLFGEAVTRFLDA